MSELLATYFDERPDLVDVEIQLRTRHTGWVKTKPQHRRIVAALMPPKKQFDRESRLWMISSQDVAAFRRSLEQKRLVVIVRDLTA